MNPLLSASLALFCLTVNGCRVASMEQGTTLDQQGAVRQSEPSARSIAEQADDTGRRMSSHSDGASYGGRYGLRPGYQACMTHQAERATTAGHRQDCADEELDFQDSRLNGVYLQAMDALKDDPAASERLRDAQLHWLSTLDASCAEVAAKAESTMGPAAQSTCLMEGTAMRASELELSYSINRK